MCRGDLVLTTTSARWGRRFADTTARIPELAQAGAAAIITDDLPVGIELPPHVPVLKVDDTRTALDALGTAARSRLVGRVICITGDYGRTATKAALLQVFGQRATVFANDEGFDRARGVALSLARTPPGVACAIYELTTRRGDSTRSTTRMLRPHVVVVTGLRRRSKPRVTWNAAADEKAIAFEGLEPGGIVVISRDSPRCDRLMLAAVEHGATRVVTFGTSPLSEVRLLDSSVVGDRCQVRACVHGRPVSYTLPSAEQPLLMGALAALATGGAIGADCNMVAEALSSPYQQHVSKT